MTVAKSRVRWPLFGALLFFLVLWLLGFPQPGFDDLFYTGAALHLAQGGDFSNPLLARQAFPSHFFYVYPPLHSHVLAGWLKVFGIHAASQTGFMMANLVVICAATLSIIRRRQAPVWAEWLVPLAAGFAFLPLGLRPETLAVALTLVGFDLSERGRQAGWLKFAGFFLMFLGASCAPRMTFFAVSLALCAGYEGWRSDAGSPAFWKIGALWLGALSGAGLVFLILIHFRLHEFLLTFRFHAARVSGKPLFILADYAKHFLGVLQWPLVLLPLAMVADAVRKPWHHSATAGIFIAAAFVPVIVTGGVGHGAIWWMLLLIFIFAGVFARNNSPGRAAAMQVMVMVALLVANRKLFANAYGLMSGNISRKGAGQIELVKSMRSSKEHPLLVDGSVARHVFDYQIPDGCLDVEFGSVFPGGLPGCINDSELQRGDRFIIGPDTVTLLMHRTYLQQEITAWAFWGMRSLAFNKYPRQVYEVRAEDCRGSRPWEGPRPVYLPKDASVN